MSDFTAMKEAIYSRWRPQIVLAFCVVVLLLAGPEVIDAIRAALVDFRDNGSWDAFLTVITKNLVPFLSLAGSLLLPAIFRPIVDNGYYYTLDDLYPRLRRRVGGIISDAIRGRLEGHDAFQGMSFSDDPVRYRNLLYFFTNQEDFEYKRKLAFQYWSTYFSAYLSIATHLVGLATGLGLIAAGVASFQWWFVAVGVALPLYHTLIVQGNIRAIKALPVGQVEDIWLSKRDEFIEQAIEREIVVE